MLERKIHLFIKLKLGENWLEDLVRCRERGLAFVA